MTFEAMSKGASGDQVADLRGRLLYLGLIAPPVGASFDDATEAAVAQYQAGAGHPASGAVDEGVWLQLCSDTDSYGYSYAQALAGAYDEHWAAQHTVIHDRAPYKDLVAILNSLSDLVTALAGDHAEGIGSACAYFQQYANDRLDQLGRTYHGGDYLKYLSRHLVGEAGKGLTELLVAPAIAAAGLGALPAFAVTSVWIAFSMTAERQVGGAVKDAVSSTEDLRKAVPRITLAITEQIKVGTNGVKRDFRANMDAVIGKINRGEYLDEEVTWLEPLLSADSAARLHFVESSLGMPTSWESVRDGVYARLVQAFEEMVIEVTEPPHPMEGAAAALLQAVNPDNYAAARAMEHAREADRERRAHAAAEDAAKKLPHAPSTRH